MFSTFLIATIFCSSCIQSSMSKIVRVLLLLAAVAHDKNTIWRMCMLCCCFSLYQQASHVQTIYMMATTHKRIAIERARHTVSLCASCVCVCARLGWLAALAARIQFQVFSAAGCAPRFVLHSFRLCGLVLLNTQSSQSQLDQARNKSYPVLDFFSCIRAVVFVGSALSPNTHTHTQSNKKKLSSSSPLANTHNTHTKCTVVIVFVFFFIV